MASHDSQERRRPSGRHEPATFTWATNLQDRGTSDFRVSAAGYRSRWGIDVRRWLWFVLGVMIAAAAVYALLTARRASGPDDQIDEASRQKLEKVLREDASETEADP